MSGVTVRLVHPYQATKRYRCPACGHAIEIGTGHYVVVPLDAPEDRRHWHRPCWERPSRERPSRSDPEGVTQKE